MTQEELTRLSEKRDKAAERLLWCIQMAQSIVLCLRATEDARITENVRSYWSNQRCQSEA